MPTLSADAVSHINRDTLRILSEIGIRVDDDALRQAAIKAGAKPGRAGDIVLLPVEMAREYIAMAPAEIHLADAAGGEVSLGPNGTSSFWTGAALNYVADGEFRPITCEDLRNFARIAERMENLWALVGTSLAEVPPPVRDVAGLAIMAAHTRKHLRPLLFDAASTAAMVEIAQIVAGDTPLREKTVMSLGYSCLPPLHWAKISTDMWRNSAGHAIPVMLNGEPITGTTSPVTLAGSLSLANAEVLGGVVLTQLLEPGRPVVHNVGFAHTVDMRTAACVAGSPECALLAAAGAQLAASWDLPSASWMCTDAFDDDHQAAMEKMLTGFAHVDAGVNIIWGMGQLESEKTLSPLQLVMDNEIAGVLNTYRQGIDVTDDTLAYDVIREVIENDEDFLGHDHTLMHFRTALSESKLLARTNRDGWATAGATSLAERAQARADEILAAEPEPVLTDQQIKDIEAIRDREFARIQ